MKNEPTGILPVICGPTATGKTSLSVELAKRLGGEIISADSRQVYIGMDIGSGKDVEEYTVDGARIPVHMIDVARPDEIFTLYDYIRGFILAYRKITVSNKLPLLVGGTGLYVEAVIKKYVLSDVPENKALRDDLSSEKKEKLVSILKDNYPDIYIKTDLSSKKRIIRGIEIGKGGIPSPVYDYPSYRPIVFCVQISRDDLIVKIKDRLVKRLNTGMIEEVEKLLSKGVSYERMMMFGMEYKYVTKYLFNEISYEDMFESLFASIRRLSKRQMTYFRGMERRGAKIDWISPGDVDHMEKTILNKKLQKSN